MKTSDHHIGEEKNKIQIQHGRYRSVLRAFSNPRREGSSLFIWVALVVIILTGISYAIHYYNPELREETTTSTITTARNESQTISLSDGSSISLQPQSSIDYPEQFAKTGDRVVDLRGEAVFTIAEESSRHFVVHAGDITATVLGTRFRMKHAPDSVTIKVLEGKVLVNTQTQKVEVEAPEQAVYVQVTHTLVKQD